MINQRFLIHRAKNGSLVLLVAITWTQAPLSQLTTIELCFQKWPQTLRAMTIFHISRCTIFKTKPYTGDRGRVHLVSPNGPYTRKGGIEIKGDTPTYLRFVESCSTIKVREESLKPSNVTEKVLSEVNFLLVKVVPKSSSILLTKILAGTTHLCR